MYPPLFDSLADDFQELRRKNLYRRRMTLESPQHSRPMVSGRAYLNFCSNDYLGLANDPRLIEALGEAGRSQGVGSGASHLVCGHSSAHAMLEQELADWVGCEKALLYANGYLANLGVIGGLLRRGDELFQDRLNHASLIDGAILSRARLRRYRHCDLTDLRQCLLAGKRRRRLIVTDGVFSMDGDRIELPEMVAMAREFQCGLYIDDAHGIGVMGESGGGLFEHYRQPVTDGTLLMATLGKAVGVYGAFVAGDRALIEKLVQSSRTYIYTTALPPALAEVARVSLGIVRRESWRRKKLRSLIDQFRTGADQMGLNILPSQSPIQPVMLGESALALKWSEQLQSDGILVSAIRPPTVPAGGARLRVTLSAGHDAADVQQLLTALGRCRQLSD